MTTRKHQKDKSHTRNRGRMLPSIPLFIFVPIVSPRRSQEQGDDETRYSLHPSSSSLSSQQSFQYLGQPDRWTSHNHHTPCVGAADTSAATTAAAVAAPKCPLRLRSDLTAHVDDDDDDDDVDTRDEAAAIQATTNTEEGQASSSSNSIRHQEDISPRLPSRSWTLPTNSFLRRRYESNPAERETRGKALPALCTSADKMTLIIPRPIPQKGNVAAATALVA